MDQLRRVLYCNCTYAEVIPPQVKREVLRRLSASRVAFEAVADLCELSARRDPALKRIAESADLRIAACFPRAVEWLFHAAGAPLTKQRVEVLNMRRQSTDQVVAGLLPDAPVAPVGPSRKQLGVPKPGAWIPWFPVIDYDRCTNCKQCLSFCLFGVFGSDADDRVEVRSPDRCKTGCPACARVCPNLAIMFPKYEKGPINGDEVREEDLKRGAVKVDVGALLGQDIHASLRARNRQARERFSAAREASGELSERVRQLKKLQAELGIPDEVIRSLGTADSAEKPAAGALARQCKCQACSPTGESQPQPPEGE